MVALNAITTSDTVTLDFSAAGTLLNEAWLKILQAVQWVGDRLAASTVRLNESRLAFDQMKEGQRALADSFTTFVDDIVIGGQKMDQALKSLAKTLASDALKALISGQGSLAGVLGVAPTERGGLGGLLGGQFSFGSLFGGSGGALQGPTLSGRTLDQEGGGFSLSSLFQGRELREAVSGGTSDGLPKQPGSHARYRLA